MKTYKLRYIYNDGHAVETYLFRCNKDVSGEFVGTSSRNLPFDVIKIVDKLGLHYWGDNPIEIFPVDVTDIEF